MAIPVALTWTVPIEDEHKLDLALRIGLRSLECMQDSQNPLPAWIMAMILHIREILHRDRTVHVKPDQVLCQTTHGLVPIRMPLTHFVTIGHQHSGAIEELSKADHVAHALETHTTFNHKDHTSALLATVLAHTKHSRKLASNTQLMVKDTALNPDVVTWTTEHAWLCLPQSHLPMVITAAIKDRSPARLWHRIPIHQHAISAHATIQSRTSC